MNWQPRAGEFVAGLAASAILWIAYAIVAAVLDGAKPADWLGLVGAMLGTMMAIGGAVMVDRYKVANERIESIREVIRASERGIELYDTARTTFKNLRWKSDEAAIIAAEADQWNATIDRLLSRPHLTDGAINIGTGSMRLMQSVRRAADVFQESNGDNFGDRAFDILIESVTVVENVTRRISSVKEYHKLPVESLDVDMEPYLNNDITR